MAAGTSGARGPLITWTVISSIVSVVAIILAIYRSAQTGREVSLPL